MPDLVCYSCKDTVAAADVLRRVTAYVEVTGSYGSTCPACGSGIEFAVRGGQIVIGYTYWAGSLHFEGVETWAVPGLREVCTGDAVALELGGTSLHTPFPVARPTDENRASGDAA